MKNNLYIDILLWAYGKDVTGFTIKEMVEKFDLGEDYSPKYMWVSRNFFGGDDSLIDSLNYDHVNKVQIYSLTRAGVEATVDYLELHEARQDARWAQWTAVIAIAISIIATVWQIISVQEVKINNESIKTELLNFPVTEASIPETSATKKGN